MDTITLPRDLYSDRRDDLDNVFVTGPTLEAAARPWIAQDPERRNVDELQHNGVTMYALTWKTEHESPMLVIVYPDENMEQLYQADLLPFDIEPSPFAAGDIVTHAENRDIERTVVKVLPNGQVTSRHGGNTFTTLPSRLTFVHTAAEAARKQLDSTPEPARHPVTLSVLQRMARQAIHNLEAAADGDSNDAEIEAAHDLAEATSNLLDYLS